MMRAMQLTGQGLNALQMVDLPEPIAGRGQVVLAMKAFSLNYRDLSVAMGKYPAKLPLIPLSDGVGVIETVGEGVKELKVGDRVAPIFAPRWLGGRGTDADSRDALGAQLDGVMAEKVVADASAVVRVPDHLSDAEAATLTVAGVTAWSALFDFAALRPGETVLIEGTGNVALFALQFAKLAGARAAIISSSDEKIARAKALGADVTVNYRANPEWGAAIAKATGGVNVVVETIGADTIPQALAACRRGARVAQVGLLSGVAANLPLQLFIPRGLTLGAILVGGRDRFEAMNRAIELHELRPVIDQVIGFGDLRKGFEAIASGNRFGKTVLTI